MQQVRRVTQTWLSLLAGMLVIVGVGERAQAMVLHVANNGLDSSTCGSRQHPCRSISQAIVNASVGDRIIVGPGRYGDLNGNGTFGEPGEEVAEVGFGCSCMIKVDKPLTLRSRDGAFATVLDAGETALLGVVRISTSKVVFGAPYRGFTIIRSGNGISGLVIAPGVTEVRVRGNLARDNGLDGFLIFGNRHTLSDNVAIHNGQDGFGVFGSEHTLRDNLAISHGQSGYFVSGSEHRLRGNLAIDNDHDGFIFEGSKHVLRGNAALGNKRFGINILGGASVIISKNNIYGNNSVEVNRQLNCGLVNGSGGLITATHNFWGAVTGPGPEPADEVCDFGRSNTVFSPFLTKEFGIPVQSLAIQGQLSTANTENQD